MPTDEEIQAELRKHTTQELIAFREKLVKINTGQAWAIRFYILKELLFRSMLERVGLDELLEEVND